MVSELITIYERDINRLKIEIESFQTEENLWKITGQVKNTAGNLGLHLVGNLKTYIGKNLGGYDYTRDREAEFNLKNVPKEQLLQQIDETKQVVVLALQQLEKTQLEEIYLEETLGYPMTTGFFLIHLAAHLSYHLGQINYLRRILE
ncbi:DinB family protein [Adhaeribacter radiodurans]|uniref:DinB family protein n=1 Tax=Adhaeribacter radiodurans TaxID=2745197 RepID=A0A7L7LEC5_9BACT|nr:DinB family protein [Adhaeribacter radiodurans]QMU31198.1 DinB family protein [Adhaeribacter radiodurans]